MIIQLVKLTTISGQYNNLIRKNNTDLCFFFEIGFIQSNVLYPFSSIDYVKFYLCLTSQFIMQIRNQRVESVSNGTVPYLAELCRRQLNK
jgi:hypothetical protein